MPQDVSGYIQFVTNLGESVNFYEKLGFIIAEKTEEYVKVRINWFWIELIKKDKAEETTFAPNLKSDESKLGGTGLYIHIGVDNVDEYYNGVIGLGLLTDSEPKDFKWGRREFILRDPDGYKLVFYHKIK